MQALRSRVSSFFARRGSLLREPQAGRTSWSGQGFSKLQNLVCTAGPDTGRPPSVAGRAKDRVRMACPTPQSTPNSFVQGVQSDHAAQAASSASPLAASHGASSSTGPAHLNFFTRVTLRMDLFAS